jgi:hypothetical protein
MCKQLSNVIMWMPLASVVLGADVSQSLEEAAPKKTGNLTVAVVH